MARLSEDEQREQTTQVMQADHEDVAAAARDAIEAARRTRDFVNGASNGGADWKFTADETGRLAAQAELDAKEIDGKNASLKIALEKATGKAASAAKPVSNPVAVDSCVNGAITCKARTPYCCMLDGADSQPDGRGECVAGFDDCKTMEFACSSEHEECPSAQGIMPWGCDDLSDDSDGTCRPGKICQCRFRFLRSEASQRAEAEETERDNESMNCANIADCERFCRRDLNASPKLMSSACTRLVDFAEKLIDGSEGSPGVIRGVAVVAKACDADLAPPGGARPAQIKACQLAAWGAALSRDAKRSYVKAARYYKRSCELGSDDGCVGAKGAACIVKTWSPSRRTPDLDRWCNNDMAPKYWTSKAYLTEDPTQRVEFDGCFAPLRTAGCTGVNVGPRTGLKLPEGQDLKSAFCCRGDRP